MATDKAMRERICRLKANGSSVRRIAEVIGVSKSTVQKVCARAGEVA